MSSAKLVILVLCVAFHVTAAGLSLDEKHDILEEHNKARSRLNLTPLVWDDTLALVAQSYAEECKWSHNSLRWQSYNNMGGRERSVGENLATASSGWKTPADMVQMWIDERAYFTYPDKCTGMCGHYTQIIWKTTTSVGCGYKFLCSNLAGIKNAAYLVCDYAPAGNIVGRAPY